MLRVHCYPQGSAIEENADGHNHASILIHDIFFSLHQQILRIRLSRYLHYWRASTAAATLGSTCSSADIFFTTLRVSFHVVTDSVARAARIRTAACAGPPCSRDCRPLATQMRVPTHGRIVTIRESPASRSRWRATVGELADELRNDFVCQIKKDYSKKKKSQTHHFSFYYLIFRKQIYIV